MKKSRYTIHLMLLSLLVGCTANSVVKPTAAPAGMEQSATFTVREHHVARLAAGTSGDGTLVFRGWEHPFTFSDARIDITDRVGIEIHGTVFNLDKLEDFEGKYHPLKMEFDADEGLTGLWGENDKGVVVHIVTVGHDVTINFEAEGAIVTLN